MPRPAVIRFTAPGVISCTLPTLSRCMIAAVEQIGDGREPDMRVRAHVHALPGHELHRAQLVEEDERPDHLPLAVRQRAADLEAAEVARARHDDEFERVAGALVAEDGSLVGIQLMGSPSDNCLGAT